MPCMTLESLQRGRSFLGNRQPLGFGLLSYLKEMASLEDGAFMADQRYIAILIAL